VLLHCGRIKFCHSVIKKSVLVEVQVVSGSGCRYCKNKLISSDVLAQSNESLVESDMYARTLSGTIDELLSLEQTGTKA
jgi:hypothetical protein